MSITPQLQASARAAYRTCFRATRVVFAGDVNALQTSHHKLRSEYETHRSTPNDSPEAYAARVTMTNEVAELLKKHVVQGVKTTEDQEAYELRILPTTERGDNATIKKPVEVKPRAEKTPFPNRGRVREGESPLKAAGGSSS